MANKTIVTFTANGNFTPPGGVTTVRASHVRLPAVAVQNNVQGFNKYSHNALGVTGLGNIFIDGLGTGHAWGSNPNGVLGNGNIQPISSPALVIGSLQWSDISMSVSGTLNGHTLGLTRAGILYSWGANNSGQLGNNGVGVFSSPILVLGSVAFAKVRAFANNNGAESAGIDQGGRAYTWGINTNGNLGLGDVVPRSSPVLVPGGLLWQDLQMGNSGNFYTIGLTTTGAAYGWGSNLNGELGINTNTAVSSPVAVVGGLTFTQIVLAGGPLGALGLTTSGAVYGWGLNNIANAGWLGDGTTVAKSSPSLVVGGLTFKSIFAGNIVSGGITTAGDLYMWGLNSSGQLGVGDVLSRSSPVLVAGGLKWAFAQTDGNSVMGITTTGAMYMWGNNAATGVLGNNTSVPASSPSLVVGGLTWLTGGVVSNSSFGISTNGQLYSWGLNVGGQLGNNTNTSSSSPALLIGNILPSAAPTVQTQTISVVPGVALAVTIGNAMATLGNNVIGYGPATQVTIEFDA